jgi:hypothetical protein
MRMMQKMCRELELSGKIASEQHPFFPDASVKRTPNTKKVAVIRYHVSPILVCDEPK